MMYTLTFFVIFVTFMLNAFKSLLPSFTNVRQSTLDKTKFIESMSRIGSQGESIFQSGS